MRCSIVDATRLAENALKQVGYTSEQAEIIVDHLMDCELRGVSYAGLARVLSIVDRHRAKPVTALPIETRTETEASVAVDGGDNIGYLVAQRATELVIGKAKSRGLGLVGACNTWYTGMLSYYAEQVVGEGLVSVIVSNASPWVAPFGGSEGRFGTNPICIAVPGQSEAVIWDIGTSEMIHAQISLARRLGEPLPNGVAYDAEGNPTTDPSEALKGAFVAWGGHRGSGLAIMVHLLGMLAGSPVIPGELEAFGFLTIAIDPSLLTDLSDFRRNVDEYASLVRDTRPVQGNIPVRMPFDRSRECRRETIARGYVNISETVYDALTRLVE